MLKNTGRLPTSAACRCRRRASSRRRPTRAAPRAAAARTCSPLSSAMPSAVESTTTTAGLDARGMRSSTERGDDDDDEQVARQRQPLQSTYRSWASSTIPRAATSVDARTACSGTSRRRSTRAPPARAPRAQDRPLVSSSKAGHLCGRVELRVGLERGVAVAGRGAMLAAYRPMRARRRDAHAARETSVARRDGVSERAAGRVRRRVLG